MALINVIGEMRRHQQIVKDAEKKIIQQSLKLGIRNEHIDAVYEFVACLWKMEGGKVWVCTDANTDDFQALDMCITEYTNDGPVIIFSVWDCNIAGELGEDAIVLLNGRNLIGDLDEQSRIKR